MGHIPEFWSPFPIPAPPGAAQTWPEWLSQGQCWRGSFPHWNTLRRVFPVMGSTSVSHHPIPGPGRAGLCQSGCPRDHIPLLASFPGFPGDFIPLLVSFSWHLHGWHPIRGILLLAFPGTACLSWHLHGLHPVLMQLKMSLLAAGAWTR